MKIHREGKNTLIIIASVLILFNLLVNVFFPKHLIILYVSIVISFNIFLVVLNFFRKPPRKPVFSANSVIAPADGKVVVIEKTVESEYFKDERIQVSIFMSLWNVHINWFPMSGMIKFFRYHSGKYFLARNPKSSTENERTTIVIKNDENKEILYRQIAGQVARRIVFYIREMDNAEQSSECGFIKFGSRVDIFLPIDADIKVKIDQKVKGSQTIIADFR